MSICRVAVLFREMNMKTLYLLIITAALGTGCQTTSFVHRQFDTRAKGLTNLVVMPVSAIAIEIQANGVRLNAFPQQGTVCQQLETLTARQFRIRGFKVARSKLATEDRGGITNDIAHDRKIWMQLQVRRANQSLARIGGHARGKIVRPEAPLLAEYEGADALIFVNASLVTESSEARKVRLAENAAGIAVSLVTGGVTAGLGSPEGSSLEVVLVEGRTGEVLWRSWTNTDSSDGRWLGTAVAELFTDYPVPE